MLNQKQAMECGTEDVKVFQNISSIYLLFGRLLLRNLKRPKVCSHTGGPAILITKKLDCLESVCFYPSQLYYVLSLACVVIPIGC